MKKALFLLSMPFIENISFASLPAAEAMMPPKETSLTETPVLMEILSDSSSDFWDFAASDSESKDEEGSKTSGEQEQNTQSTSSQPSKIELILHKDGAFMLYDEYKQFLNKVVSTSQNSDNDEACQQQDDENIVTNKLEAMSITIPQEEVEDHHGAVTIAAADSTNNNGGWMKKLFRWLFSFFR